MPILMYFCSTELTSLESMVVLWSVNTNYILYEYGLPPPGIELPVALS